MFTPSLNNAPGGGAIMTRFGTKQDVNRIVKMLSEGGFSLDRESDRIRAFDGGVTVYRALKKNANEWIVWYNENYFG